MINKIATAISEKGGRVFYVGGYVRDQIIGKESKDIDVEIYGIGMDVLLDTLSQFGEVDTVGKSFGIIKMKGFDIDISIPRAERKRGVGHRDFDVAVDPFMSFEDACRRRDFTINSILRDVLTDEVIDPFGGIQDLKDGIVRHIDPATFVEDPLRVYRAAQFAGRFGFEIAPQTVELCSSIELDSLPKERVYEEILKLLMKSPKPSVGFEYLRAMGVIKKYHPHLHSLIGCEQQLLHHPEGDVWTHTMMVVDEAASLRDKSTSPVSFMLGALLHDIGKPASRKINEEGKITFYDHDCLGVSLAQEYLKTLTEDKALTKDVLSLVEHHMKPMFLYKPHTTDSAVRRLANKCNIREILLLHEADHLGRGKFEDFTPIREWFNERIDRMSLGSKIEPLVQGRDLIALGMKPGVHFGPILKAAFEMQLDGSSYEEIIEKITDDLKNGRI